jgi:farnesyl-diphosphate farnesyltransferase
MAYDLPDPLGPLLTRVSRSFGLSLRVLPLPLRRPLALAYLLARAADSIADTRLLARGERAARLARLVAALDPPAPELAVDIGAALTAGRESPAEAELLRRLPECVALLAAQPPADRGAIVALLRTLAHGMRVDLERFPGDRLVALETRDDLEAYTFYAAGCVGEFWTDMALAHCRPLAGWDRTPMAALGRRFGQALQLTNVLRDLPQDLRMGRCYVPRRELASRGLVPEDLLAPDRVARARPVLAGLLDDALAGYADGWAYVRAVPASAARLRLACAWPLLIGLRTLERIRRAPNLLDPGVRVKIPRRAVYGILASSALLVRWDAGLAGYHAGLRRRAVRAGDTSPVGGGR